MPITIQCSGCDKKLKVADAAAGKKVRCPSCNAVIAVPLSDDLVAPDEETAVSESPVPPPAQKKKAGDDLVEPDEETAVTKTPKKKAAWDEGSAEDKEEDGYGYDEGDEEDDEDERRRRRKKKRQRDDDYGDMRRDRRMEAHRGILILILGIVALFGACLCAIIGWGLGAMIINMANTDIGKMDSRAMDPAGRGLTVAGKACAIIAVGLGLVNAILGIYLRFNR